MNRKDCPNRKGLPTRRRRAATGVTAALLLGFASTLTAHDLFLRADTYFVDPHKAVEIMVLNGTFDESEGPVARDRVRDITVVGPDRTSHPDTTAWRPERDTTYLQVHTGASGTYVVGASVLPRVLALSAEDFNRYLESDGIPDVLEARRRDGELGKPARERYSKHVKAVLQVGDRRSNQFGTVLGYPAELIPLENPYGIGVGDTLAVRALVDGRPVADQLVLAGGRDASGQPIAEQESRTDAEGIARFVIDREGQWYVKFIHMVRLQSNPELDYESKWATLTFEIREHGSEPAQQDSVATAAVIDRFHHALATGDSAQVAMLLLPDVVILESGGVETRDEYLAGTCVGTSRSLRRYRASVVPSMSGYTEMSRLPRRPDGIRQVGAESDGGPSAMDDPSSSACRRL